MSFERRTSYYTFVMQHIIVSIRVPDYSNTMPLLEQPLAKFITTLELSFRQALDQAQLVERPEQLCCVVVVPKLQLTVLVEDAVTARTDHVHGCGNIG